MGAMSPAAPCFRFAVTGPLRAEQRRGTARQGQGQGQGQRLLPAQASLRCPASPPARVSARRSSVPNATLTANAQPEASISSAGFALATANRQKRFKSFLCCSLQPPSLGGSPARDGGDTPSSQALQGEAPGDAESGDGSPSESGDTRSECGDGSPSESSDGSGSPRRSIRVEFTCDKCGHRTTRLINPLALTKGTIFLQCAGCGAIHQFVDNLGLIEEINYKDEEGQQAKAS